ncbi:Sec-independent protein translocase protein TatB [Planctomycetes bacterium Pla163]|uniref:Sec-independent protein translocase protein TatB n=1 Tax=Rohdeia mirabilis TaxID=2528008 RepID=A0A518CUP5_9BACT|nr:Sec-independent protein translocase protein TatB [Planctomycetes bacterium Pla163]
MLPALNLPNIQEWILIAVVAVLLFGRRLPEVIAQVLHGIRVAREHLDELRRSSGFDQDLRDAQRALRDTRDTLKREARELTAPIPTVQSAKDAVRRSVTGVRDDLEDSIRTAKPPADGVERNPESARIDEAHGAGTASSAGGGADANGPEQSSATKSDGASSAAKPAPDPAASRAPDPEPRDPGHRD